MTLFADRRVRVAGLTLYYLAIVAGLLLLASQGGSATPTFVYQAF
jgi:hypothetical protein